MTAFFNYFPKGSKEDEATLFWTSTVTEQKAMVTSSYAENFV